jgi:hypothetical protein
MLPSSSRTVITWPSFLPALFRSQDFGFRRSLLIEGPSCCWGMADARTDSSNWDRASGDAVRSALRLKTRTMLSLAPETMSPFSGQTATDHTEMAGCVIVWMHSEPLQIRTVRSSPALTISPVGRQAREYMKLSWP